MKQLPHTLWERSWGEILGCSDSKEDSRLVQGTRELVVLQVGIIFRFTPLLHLQVL